MPSPYNLGGAPARGGPTKNPFGGPGAGTGSPYLPGVTQNPHGPAPSGPTGPAPALPYQPSPGGFNIPPAVGAPNPGMNPSTGYPWQKGQLTMPNILSMLSQQFNWSQGQNNQYRGAAQDNYNNLYQGPMWTAMTGGLQNAMKPVVDPQMLSQLQGAGRDRVAREGQQLQDSLHAQLAAQGMQTGMYNPSYMGAQYNTMYQAGQSDIQQQLAASQMNQQGLLGALGAGQGMAGVQQGGINSMNDLLGQFSQGDTKFLDALLALFGAKLGKPGAG